MNTIQQKIAKMQEKDKIKVEISNYENALKTNKTESFNAYFEARIASLTKDLNAI